MGVELLDQGRLLVATEHLPLLRANGLDTFERIMAMPEDDLRRNFPGRRTNRLELRRPDGSIQAVYLKRYYPDYLSTTDRLLRRLGWPGYGDEARAEWDAIECVAALGIPTLTAMARGQDQPSPGAVRSSFVMTAELTGTDEGDRVAAGLSPEERQRLLRRVAAYTRQLHEAGHVHRDLYLCHYMVATEPPNVPGCERPVFLIDLQRLTRPRWFPERWRIKDLAALIYSSLKAGATEADLAEALQSYLGRDHLDASGRRLAEKVRRRVAWLKTRRPKHDTNFRQLK